MRSLAGTRPTVEFWINSPTFWVTQLHLSERQFPNLQNGEKENSPMGG